MQRRLAFIVAICLTLAPTANAFAAGTFGQAPITCTLVIGFSQTYQWFYGGPPGFDQFISATGRGSWGLLWQGGATVDAWADPGYEGWRAAQSTSCTQNATRPERVVLNISGDFNNDPGWWVQQTTAAIGNIRHAYPSVKQIVLQPVIGGPSGGQCFIEGRIVRATSNQPVIIQAIGQLTSGDIVAGPNPEVRSCADYADDIGHLTDSARGPIASSIATYYTSGRLPPVGAPPSPLTPTPGLQPVVPAGAPFCAAGDIAVFSAGFSALQAQLGDTMGVPRECEHTDPDTGDILQQTTTGIALYRQATNTPTFSDGTTHWALTQDGLIDWTGDSLDPP